MYRPKEPGGQERSESFHSTECGGVQAQGLNRYPVDAGICAKKQRVVSAE